MLAKIPTYWNSLEGHSEIVAPPLPPCLKHLRRILGGISLFRMASVSRWPIVYGFGLKVMLAELAARLRAKRIFKLFFGIPEGRATGLVEPGHSILDPRLATLADFNGR